MTPLVSLMHVVTPNKFGHKIEIELALKEERRKICRDFLKVSRAEYDRLLESSPSIDQDIIALFDKRFNNDYPHVSKPIVYALPLAAEHASFVGKTNIGF